MVRGTTRREFLRLTGTALAGSALPAPAFGKDDVASRPLVRRTLGRTGLELPVVSMGTNYTMDLVRAALERGIVYIHTSSGYGRHEHLLGRAVRGRDRDSFVVATSPDLPYELLPGRDRTADIGLRNPATLIIESLEESLRELALDYVDIYYLGSVDTPATLQHEAYKEAFERLKRDGKIRFGGIATHANEPAIIRAAATDGFWDVVLTAFNFRQSHREAVRSAIHEAAAAGMGVVAMKTQAGVYWDRERVRKIDMAAALRWVLSDEHVHTAIPAFANLQELREDLEVARNPVLTPSERRNLEAGDDLGFSGNFCDQCGDCRAQCSAGMDVPLLMRCHLYSNGHQQPGKARYTLRSWRAGDVMCRDCAACTVTCPRSVDVRSRALDMARLLDVPKDLTG